MSCSEKVLLGRQTQRGEQPLTPPWVLRTRPRRSVGTAASQSCRLVLIPTAAFAGCAVPSEPLGRCQETLSQMAVGRPALTCLHCLCVCGCHWPECRHGPGWPAGRVSPCESVWRHAGSVLFSWMEPFNVLWSSISSPARDATVSGGPRSPVPDAGDRRPAAACRCLLFPPLF